MCKYTHISILGAQERLRGSDYGGFGSTLMTSPVEYVQQSIYVYMCICVCMHIHIYTRRTGNRF